MSGGFRTAVGFLTRIPVRHHEVTSEQMGAAVGWFPAVGAVIGLVTGTVFAAGAWLLPGPAAASLALVVSALLTGGFHEDGLADVADAFGGGYSSDDVRRILKDSRHGTFGVLALVSSFGVKAACLAVFEPWTGLVVLVAAHVGGRALAVGLMGRSAPASGDGLGSSYLSAVSARPVLAATASGLVVVALGLGAWSVVAVVGGVAAVVLMRRLSYRRLGGVVGDVLGATEQLGEIVILAVAASMVGGRWAPLDPVSLGGLVGWSSWT